MPDKSSGLAVKICGLKKQEEVEAALRSGADLIGFVFFERSPRNLSPAQAQRLRALLSRGQCVALTVDAQDGLLDAIMAHVAPDYLQLHGAESMSRARELKERYGVKIIRALGVAAPDDLQSAPMWEEVADMLLFDAKPPKKSDRPGGNGHKFDWSIMRGRRASKPWLLSGGLNAENVAAAISATGAPGVDVSSGVESAPGVKDVDKIELFLRAARGLPKKLGETA